jgi:DNA-binding Xre family transcriptional regulator
MIFNKKLKKAMIDKEIDSVKALSEQTGVSKYIIDKLLKNDGSCRLDDLIVVSNFLEADVFNTKDKGE